MSSVCGDEGCPPQWNDQGSSAHEEKIYVSIRVRPLNDRENSRNDVADWECIDSTTILFKNAQGERSNLPAAYQFDRVFGQECSTREVYDEAAKRVVLSVLSGMNASIFAYGQTSSGKTYTMSAITAYAMQDIFEYIEKCSDRKFMLKFSAIEIYNEVVRDLLSTDNTPLRLLDDPERGTVVEKLSEVMPRDQSHLSELLSICEAQRQIGETTLNGMSSRSHQILRLTIESSTTQYSHPRNNSTLSAAVNFIDLAGSERASQTLSAGTRLKEGCHINRSLLTLGTVIRKLSKGRNGHIPYRDSKLTRILQHSLGGNARTAIICTMSPAHSHVEQSRNTLLFATCAKQVATKAQVNVVMSDKALVKQLQKELAKLESELRALRSRSVDETSSLVLKEKEALIEKMEKEMRDLMMQRDMSQSQVQNLLRSRPWAEMSCYSDTSEYPASEVSSATPFQMDAVVARMSSFSDRFEAVTEGYDDSFLSDGTSPRHFIDKYFGPDPSKDWHIATHKSSHSFGQELQRVEMESTAGSLDFTEASFDYGDYQPDFEAMGYSPFSETGISGSSNISKLRSCKSLLATVHGKHENGQATRRLGKQFSGKLKGFDHKKVTRSRGTSDSGMVLDSGFIRAANDESSNVKGHNIKVSMDAGFNNPAANNESFNAKGHNVMVSMNIGFNSAAKDESSSDVKGHNVKVSMDTGFVSPANDESLDVKGHKFKVSMDAGFNNSPTNDESSDVKVSMDAGFNSAANDESSDVKVSMDDDPTAREETTNENAKLCHTNEDVSSANDGSLDLKEHEFKASMDNVIPYEEVFAAMLEGAKGMPEKQNCNENEDLKPVPEKQNCNENEALKPVPEKQNCNENEDLKAVPKNQLLVDLLHEDEPKDKASSAEVANAGAVAAIDLQQTPSEWPEEFERQRSKIIELWDACHVPLVHRTYFFLLFKGDPSDAVYMEVEFRRLCFLKNSWSRGERVVKDGQVLTEAASVKALKRERDMLCKQMVRTFSASERNDMFQQWGIGLSSKQRRLQLCNRLWKNTKDMEHLKKSAALVAKLVGIIEPNAASKEMFGLSFAPQPMNFRSFSWAPRMPFII
ncbi:PREDICTED: kinesin-like protein KIN-7J [Ipomoea nil]|uniref:kinesin-like protein KIN-7J n=1 Tax=Ipomoea nil TaxID=35883 RepID=UPI000900C2D1|nr:PREDICTED: kinesin-like protein KIN-7J [Ipomoea nil]